MRVAMLVLEVALGTSIPCCRWRGMAEAVLKSLWTEMQACQGATTSTLPALLAVHHHNLSLTSVPLT